MTSSHFKERLKSETLGRKMLLFGTFLSVISTLLPWYSDMDRFNIGDTFLGISGPLYLAGFIVLAASGASFTLIMLHLLGKKQPKLPIKEGHLHVFSGIISGVMLVLVNSVYFHPKFGISIADKSLGVGMMIAFAGVSLFLFAAIASRNAETVLILKQSNNLEDQFLNMTQGRGHSEITRERTVEDAISEHRKEMTKDTYE